MQATAVKPPATADAVPVATVSLCSCPGSRRCTCMSIRPGHTTQPRGTSTTVAPSAGRSRPTAAIAIAVDQHVEVAVEPVGRVDHAGRP